MEGVSGAIGEDDEEEGENDFDVLGKSKIAAALAARRVFITCILFSSLLLKMSAVEEVDDDVYSIACEAYVTYVNISLLKRWSQGWG